MPTSKSFIPFIPFFVSPLPVFAVFAVFGVCACSCPCDWGHTGQYDSAFDQIPESNQRKKYQICLEPLKEVHTIPHFQLFPSFPFLSSSLSSFLSSCLPPFVSYPGGVSGLGHAMEAYYVRSPPLNIDTSGRRILGSNHQFQHTPPSFFSTNQFFSLQVSADRSSLYTSPVAHRSAHCSLALSGPTQSCFLQTSTGNYGLLQSRSLHSTSPPQSPQSMHTQ